MDMYVVKVKCEGQEWYVHQNGARINDRETAMLHTHGEAVQTSEHYKKYWKAECEIVAVDDAGR